MTSGFSTAALPFTVGPVTATLTVTATSSDQLLVPNADIVLGGSGADRTVTVKSAANESGTATITLTVSDGTQSATDSFAMTISPGKAQNFTVKFTPKGKAEKDGHSTRLFGKTQTTNKAGVIKSITITNIGKKPLTGLKILKDGGAPADFVIKGLNKKPLPRGKSITVDVVFRPKKEGSKQAFLHITSSESIENPFDLTLTGTGVRGKKQR